MENAVGAYPRVRPETRIVVIITGAHGGTPLQLRVVEGAAFGSAAFTKALADYNSQSPITHNL